MRVWKHHRPGCVQVLGEQLQRKGWLFCRPPHSRPAACPCHATHRPGHSPLIDLEDGILDEGGDGGHHALVVGNVRLDVVLKVGKASRAVQRQLAHLLCSSGSGRSGSRGGRGRTGKTVAGERGSTSQLSNHEPLKKTVSSIACSSAHPNPARRRGGAPAKASGRSRSPTRTPLRVALEE